MVADGEEVVRELHEELVRVVRVDAARGEAVGETGTIVEVTGVDEEEVNVLLKRDLLHVVDEGREVTEGRAEVRLGLGSVLVSCGLDSSSVLVV